MSQSRKFELLFRAPGKSPLMLKVFTGLRAYDTRSYFWIRGIVKLGLLGQMSKSKYFFRDVYTGVEYGFNSKEVAEACSASVADVGSVYRVRETIRVVK